MVVSISTKLSFVCLYVTLDLLVRTNQLVVEIHVHLSLYVRDALLIVDCYLSHSLIILHVQTMFIIAYKFA